MSPEDRTYRAWVQTELCAFHVRAGQSDLLISADRPLREAAARTLRALRRDLEAYLQRDPDFAAALDPRDPAPGAPPIAAEMADAARLCAVGPMAAVAGAVAQHVGEALLRETGQIIVENGGDIFLYTTRPRLVAIYAGQSPLSGRIGVRVRQIARPLGVCTSSGTVGHSLSLGRADAAIVLADSAALADAAATALGNRVQQATDTEDALVFVRETPGLLGGAVILGEHLGAWGDLELVPLPRNDQKE